MGDTASAPNHTPFLARLRENLRKYRRGQDHVPSPDYAYTPRAETRPNNDPVREPAARPGKFCSHQSDTAEPNRTSQKGLPVVDGLRTTTRASKLDDASGTCCDDDDAAERDSDEQGDAERKLAVEDEERDGHRVKILQDEDEHEHEGCHQDDHSGPHSARTGSYSAGFGGRSRRDFGPRLRGGRWLRPVRFRIILRVRHRPFTAGCPVGAYQRRTRPGR
jgi:hypothetical protein